MSIETLRVEAVDKITQQLANCSMAKILLELMLELVKGTQEQETIQGILDQINKTGKSLPSA